MSIPKRQRPVVTCYDVHADYMSDGFRWSTMSIVYDFSAVGKPLGDDIHVVHNRLYHPATTEIDDELLTPIGALMRVKGTRAASLHGCYAEFLVDPGRFNRKNFNSRSRQLLSLMLRLRGLPKVRYVELDEWNGEGEQFSETMEGRLLQSVI